MAPVYVAASSWSTDDGAIANVLVKSDATGVPEQVTDQPRTQRLAQPVRTTITP
ncbi:hypothetical protein [Streptomyces albospinus]|uniref:hypothetical protein n=1 Tax=Streptomyces albospinus TaxID=285515 RepID=UPI00166FE15B|nr:hypothetical protein [Streptomyces albospinus]